MKKLALLLIFILAGALFSGLAEGNGTVTVIFKNKDEVTGTETPLDNAYIYLRPASQDSPRKMYYTPAAFVLGPSDANGVISASVPEGEYHIRIARRNPLGPVPRPLGPPEASDYSWHQTDPITISTGTVTDLGTKMAHSYGAVVPSITISGTVVDYLGSPAPGRYVRAQSTQCILANYSSPDPAEWVDSNHCGPDKHLALGRTDANGKYTLFLKDPGTYWIYGSTCLGDQHQPWLGNPCVGTQAGPLPITVGAGDKKTLNFWTY